jgi:signal transduction histidine kinase
VSTFGQVLEAPQARQAPRPSLTLVRGGGADADDPPLALRAIRDLATSDDLASGMTRVAATMRDAFGAARVDWLARDDDGGLRVVATDGHGSGPRQTFAVDGAGELVVFGGTQADEPASSFAQLAPLIRRRSAEERLARTAVRLAQRNEALEDFASLVAHELKTPLHAALVAGDATRSVQQALELVDTLLDCAGDTDATGFASAAEALDGAVEDIDLTGVEITTDLATLLPISACSLRTILRNLLGNARAAGAHHVHVSSTRAKGSWSLHVDDDGVGLEGNDRYASGSGVGLQLTRRIAERFGGAIDLTPREAGGTRATLAFEGSR